MFTMHGTTMVFFMGMPILIGIGNYLVPLMIGARDMAFPRLNALGFWVTLFGGLLVYFSFATGGAPAIGWFAYAPLTEHTFARGAGHRLLGPGPDRQRHRQRRRGAINFIATILAMRCPGMTLRKVPFFTWTMLWTSVQILFAIPPLTAALVMVLLDRNLGAHFFDAQNGGSALPVAAPVLVLRPSRGLHPDPAGLRHDLRDDPGLLAQGALRLRVHGRRHRGHRLHQPRRLGPPHVHRGHEPDRGPLLRRVQPSWSPSRPGSSSSTGWPRCTAGGSRIASPMLFCLGFLSMFLIGGLTGIMLAAAPFDFQLTDSYFVVGHFHWVLIGGTLFGVFAGIHYWYPKVTGRMLSERLARWQFWLLLIGFLLTFGPMHISGMLGMPRRIYTYQADRGWALWNQLTTLGRFIQAPSYRDLRVQPARLPEERAAGRRRPLGRLDAGMGHDLAAAVVQLRDDPDGPQPPAALGPETSGRSGLEVRMTAAVDDVKE